MHILAPNDPEYVRLFEKSEPVDFDRIAEIAKLLVPRFRRVMDNAKPRAVGLCAPQVGIFERWFMLHLDGIRRFYANPNWVATATSKKEWDQENCFSAPGFQTRVERETEIFVSWIALDGTQRSNTMTGYATRAFQHEHDHLEGRTIFPRDWYLHQLKGAVALPQATEEARLGEIP